MATTGSVSVTVTSWNTLKFIWTLESQSVANNTSVVHWTMQLIAGSDGYISSTAPKDWSVTVNGTTYAGTNTVGISNNATKTLASGKTTIIHNSDGTKTFSFSFSQEFAITFQGASIGTKNGSGSGTLTTIPRASSLTAGNGTLGSAQTLTINRADSSFKHRLQYVCGSASGYIAGSSSSYTTATSISWTPPLSLASQNTTGTSVSVRLTLTTYTSGGTRVGAVNKTISCAIPASVKPSVTLTVTDSTGLADTYGNPVKGLSRFRVVVTPTTSYGSAIASYNTTANGAKYTAASFTTGVLIASGTQTVSTTVKDKRGRTATASRSLTVLDYVAPAISELFVRRCNADGTANQQGAYVQATFSGRVTSLNSKNTATYTFRYRKTTESTFTTSTLTDLQDVFTVTDHSIVISADTGSSYVVEISVEDNHGSASRATTASTAFTLMHWGTDGTSIGVGKIAEFSGLDIGMQTRFDGGLLQPIIPPETDLNDIRTPNTYVGGNLSNYNYENCPLESGTFTLDVVGAGETDQVLQRVQSCGKVGSRTFERYYYSGTWGNWFCVSDYAGVLLWEGAWYMLASQTVSLPEAISKQKNGIVLIFGEYISGAAGNSAFHCFFIPKKQVELQPGKGHTFTLATGKFGYMATKYLYINDTSIVGHADNNATGTGTSGITYTNNRFILQYVIGV